MAYTRIDGELADFDRDHPWKKEYVSHMEDGIDDCESQCAELKDSLTEKASYITLSATSTPLSECMQLIQDQWDNVPDNAISVLYLNMQQRGAGLIFKFQDDYGAAVVFGYSAAVNPPLLIRNLNNTWTQYSFTVS